MTDSSFGTGSPESSQSPDWEALARELAGESAPGEGSRLSPSDREMLRAMESALSGMTSSIPQDLDVEGALAQVKARPEFRERDNVIPFRVSSNDVVVPRTRWRVPMPALAAAALLAVGIASWQAY